MPRSTLRAAVSAIFALSMLTGALSAQSLDVPGPLTSGQTVTIAYENSALAGQIVVVEVWEPGSTTPVQLEITLDKAGKGKVDWVVPNWRSASFCATGVEDVTVPII